MQPCSSGLVVLALWCVAGARSSADPLLPGDDDVTVAEWTFDTDAQGWAAANNLAPLQVEGGILRTQATGPDAFMTVRPVGVRADDVTHLIVRMRSDQAGACQIYFATSESPDPAANAVPVFVCPGDNAFHESEVRLAGQTGFRGDLSMLRVDPVNGGGESAHIEIDTVRLVRQAPRLRVLCFAPDKPLVRPGESLVLNLVVSDTTGADLSAFEAEVEGMGTQRLARDETTGHYSAKWMISAPETAPQPLTAHLRVGERPIAVLETCFLTTDLKRAANAPDQTISAGPGGPAMMWLQSEEGVLQGILLAEDHAGERRTFGVCSPLVTVVYEADGVYHQHVGRFDRRPSRPGDGVEWRGSLPDGSRILLRVDPDRGRRVIRAECRLTAGLQMRVLRLNGPVLRAGAGSFGEAKDAALLPGIEFLASGERSSDTGPVGETVGYRPAPAPYQITVPVMAVCHDGVLGGVLWDPLQRWDGEHAMPMAEFASPNFLDAQADHLMSVLVPTTPDWGPPNERAATKPYVLAAGRSLTLTTDLFCEAGSDITRAVPRWYEVYGTPRAPHPAKPLAESLGDLIRGWAETCYDPESGGFVNHWRVGQTPAPTPSVLADILSYSIRTGERRWAEICGIADDAQILDIVAPIGPDFGTDASPSVIDTQQPDGTWAYECPPDQVKRVEEWTDGTRHDLGEPGSSSMGLCAPPAIELLYHALRTGNKESERAGIRALEAMMQSTVPAGAETWEVHKDIPDVYSAALGVDAYRIGHELTGDARYLERARYWAYTGLPFLYSYPVPASGPGATVNVAADPDAPDGGSFKGSHRAADVFENPDRHPTPYGSIPAFGTSFYRVTWFGNLVQWCGLVWANSVFALLAHGDDPVLRAAAEGVTISGCEQTFDRPPVAGLLPDTWHLGPNVIHPTFIGPGRVEPALRAMLNEPDFVGVGLSVVRVGGARVHISSRAIVTDARAEGHSLRYEARFLPGQVWDAMLIGPERPERVEVGGVLLAEVAAPGPKNLGWRYLPDGKRLLVFAGSPKERCEVEIRWP